MVNSADLWVLTATFVFSWYAFGAASVLANEGDEKRELRIMFFGHWDDDGFPWWGMALMTTVMGLSGALALFMLLAMDA